MDQNKIVATAIELQGIEARAVAAAEEAKARLNQAYRLLAPDCPGIEGDVLARDVGDQGIAFRIYRGAWVLWCHGLSEIVRGHVIAAVGTVQGMELAYRNWPNETSDRSGS